MTLARQSGDPTAVAIAAFAYANERYVAGDADESVAVSREALRAAEQAGDGSRVGSALGRLVGFALAAGNVDEYEQVLARHAQLAETLRIPLLQWFAAGFRAGRLLTRGELAAAETALDDVLVLTDPTNPTQLLGYGAQLIGLRQEQARAAEIVDLVRDAVDQNPGLPAARIALARILLQTGEIDEARAHYLPLLTDVTRTIPNNTQPIGIAQLADICDTIDDDPTDGALTEWLTPRANQNIVVAGALDCWGSAHRSLGTLARLAGRLDDAETHLEHALIANQRLGSARWVTRTQYDLARVLLLQHDRPGDRDRAIDLVGAARPVAEQHGLQHTLNLLDSLELGRA